jgi:hypothetical protein
MDVVKDRLGTNSNWHAGRNVKEVYERAWGLQFGKLGFLVQQQCPFWVDVLSYKGVYLMASIFADFTNRSQLFVAGGG